MCNTVSMTSQSGRQWPSLLSPRQAAEMVDCNEQTLRVWLREGVVRGRRMPGGSYVLSRGDVLVDIARHRQQVAASRGRRASTGAAPQPEDA